MTKSRNLRDFSDWLHWHLDVVGFEHCHVFDNESQVDVKSVCDFHDERVSYELVTGWPDQYSLYNRYINNKSKSWWVLPIDDDEYLWMRDFANVSDMLIHYQDKWKDMDKLSVRWLNMFPADAEAERGDVSLMDFCRNTNWEWSNLFEGGDLPVKTFVRTTSKVLYSIPTGETHNPINGRLSYMCNGARLKGNWFTSGPFDDDELKILHYQFKSKSEWVWKCENRHRVSMKDPSGYNKSRRDVWRKMK